jgi:energy-coupling factor transport system permease protein
MISLRFVPTLAMELETVAKAQASRLGQIGSAGRRPDKLARSLLPLVVPLFVNAFRRAEELAMAMDARGYMGGAGRTKFVSLKATPLDVALSIGMVLICVAALFVPWPALNQWLSVL